MNIINYQLRKARKQHRCENGHVINKGETYHYKFIVDGGDNWSYKLCKPCKAAFNSLHKHINKPWDEGIVIEPTGNPGFVTDGEYAANQDGNIFEKINEEWVLIKKCEVKKQFPEVDYE